MKKSPILVESGFAYETSGLVHRVREPVFSGQPHPTAVMIHGHLGNEDAMWIFAPTLPPDWLIVAPRAVVPVAEKSFTWHARGPQEWPSLTQFREPVDIITRFIHSLPDLYHADLEQLYLMGFSQGAAVSFATAIQNPGWIKGIASLVGFMPLQVEAAVETKALQQMPVFMAAGQQDERVPIDIANRCAAAVRAMGADLTYEAYETGHKLNAAGMRALRGWWQERSQPD